MEEGLEMVVNPSSFFLMHVTLKSVGEELKLSSHVNVDVFDN